MARRLSVIAAFIFTFVVVTTVRFDTTIARSNKFIPSTPPSFHTSLTGFYADVHYSWRTAAGPPAETRNLVRRQRKRGELVSMVKIGKLQYRSRSFCKSLLLSPMVLLLTVVIVYSAIYLLDVWWFSILSLIYNHANAHVYLGAGGEKHKSNRRQREEPAATIFLCGQACQCVCSVLLLTLQTAKGHKRLR